MLGVVLGSICGRLRWVRAAVLPLVNSIRPLSPVALTPLFIIWFGIGEPSKVLLVSYTTTVTLFFSTMSGVASTPTIRERAAKSLGASKLAFALQVIVPSSVPFILTGLRIAISQAYMAVVAAELIGASSGLGYLIMSSRMNLLTQRMFVGLVALAVLGLLTDFIVRRLVARYGGRFLGDDASRSV
jgi:NitT/TauT family transport system permease protein